MVREVRSFTYARSFADNYTRRARLSAMHRERSGTMRIVLDTMECLEKYR